MISLITIIFLFFEFSLYHFLTAQFPSIFSLIISSAIRSDSLFLPVSNLSRKEVIVTYLLCCRLELFHFILSLSLTLITLFFLSIFDHFNYGDLLLSTYQTFFMLFQTSTFRTAKLQNYLKVFYLLNRFPCRANIFFQPPLFFQHCKAGVHNQHSKWSIKDYNQYQFCNFSMLLPFLLARQSNLLTIQKLMNSWVPILRLGVIFLYYSEVAFFRGSPGLKVITGREPVYVSYFICSLIQVMNLN